tara:strand:+ start:360 stop:608 length:249 start_codon:yes stop_codon:yes gene_type:complete
MIRLLLLGIFLLFFIWLLLELFSKRKNQQNQSFLSGTAKYFFIALILLAIIFFAPKLVAPLIGFVKSSFLPILGILRNFLPF